MRPFLRSLRSHGLSLALLSAAFTVAAQDYEAQFVKGVRAVGDGNWSEAISDLRAAIRTRSHESSDPVRMNGSRATPYLPHYYLGLAYANSANCATAIEEFAISEQQGAIQQTDKYRSLLIRRTLCLPTPTAVAVVVPPVPIRLLTPTQRTMVPETVPPPLPGGVAATIDGASKLDKSMKAKVQQPVVVPALLLKGAAAYFAGDYARAEKTLAAAPDFPDRSDAARTRMFRSAARFALYIVGGAKDEKLQQLALRDASDCRRLDPRVLPRPAYFSPLFIEFFSKATAASRPAS